MNDAKLWNRKLPHPSDSIYIGRPTKWGNPFKAGIDGSRKEVIAMYRKYLYTSGLIDDIHELTGKHLVCWCCPKECHGDVLISLANDPFGDFYE